MLCNKGASMSRRKQKKSEVLIFKTFEIQWVNHPQFGNSYQFVAEDVLFEDITVDLKSFAIAEDLSYADAMIHFIGENMCMITRTKDLRIPINGGSFF
jgi:hypothetical protein